MRTVSLNYLLGAQDADLCLVCINCISICVVQVIDGVYIIKTCPCPSLVGDAIGFG